MVEIKFRNLLLKELHFLKINEHFYMKNNEKGYVVIYAIDTDIQNVESSHPLLLHAIDLALPQKIISPSCTDNAYENIWESRVLFSYYGNTQYKDTAIYELTEESLNHLLQWHRIIIEYSKLTNHNKNELLTPWNVGYNEYLMTISCGNTEQSFVHLISALEALLVIGSAELSYRTSLNASILLRSKAEERKVVFDCVKKSYNIRSKVVHGDIGEIKKQFKKQEIYDTLFRLKTIVSDILFLTYGKDKNAVIELIDNSIFNCELKLD